MLDTSDSGDNSGPTAVRHLEWTLLWPLRVDPRRNSVLWAERHDANQSPATLLERYSRHIEDNSTWRRVQNPFQEFFGVPGIYSSEPESARYSEYLYFHPFIHRILYGTNRDGDPASDARMMAVLTRSDVGFLRATFRNRPNLGKNGCVTLPVRRLQMFLFPFDLAIVAVQLTFSPPESGTALSIDDCLAVLNQVRRTCPPYFEPAEGGSNSAGDCPHSANWLDKAGNALHCYKSDTEICRTDYDNVAHFVNDPPAAAPCAKHWKCLLTAIVPWTSSGATNDLCFRQLGDERMPLMAYVAVDNPRSIPDEQMARLAFVDRPGFGWFYDPQFLGTWKQRFCYDRFWHEGTRYLCSGHAFVALGPSRGFFVDVILDHFRQHYFLMGLLAHMQRAALLVFWDRLSEIVRDYVTGARSKESQDDFHRRLQWLAQDFAHFFSVFSFSEVSAQTQGFELFELWRKHLRVPELSVEVREQLQFAAQIEQTNFEEEIHRISNRALPLLIVLSFLGINLIPSSFGEWLFGAQGAGLRHFLRNRLFWLPPDWAGFVSFLGAAVATIAVIVLATYIYRLLVECCWNRGGSHMRPRNRFPFVGGGRPS